MGDARAVGHPIIRIKQESGEPNFMAMLQRAVFVEFDTAVLHGMKDYVAAANDVLSPLGVPIDAIAFERFLCGRTRVGGVTVVLERAGVKQEVAPLATQIMGEYKKAVLAQAASVKDLCAAFAAPLLEKNINVVWVTQADDVAVTEALGDAVKEGVQVLHEPSQYVGGYSWENWRRLCRRLEVYERLCAAVVGSGQAAKGAIASGLYVAACADPLAENQDFGGVDTFVEQIDKNLAADLLRMLWQTN